MTVLDALAALCPELQRRSLQRRRQEAVEARDTRQEAGDCRHCHSHLEGNIVQGTGLVKMAAMTKDCSTIVGKGLVASSYPLVHYPLFLPLFPTVHTHTPARTRHVKDALGIHQTDTSRDSCTHHTQPPGKCTQHSQLHSPTARDREATHSWASSVRVPARIIGHQSKGLHIRIESLQMKSHR